MNIEYRKTQNPLHVFYCFSWNYFSSSAAFIWNGIAQNTLTTIRKRVVFYAFCYTSESVYIQGNGKYEPFLGHEHE